MRVNTPPNTSGRVYVPRSYLHARWELPWVGDSGLCCCVWKTSHMNTTAKTRVTYLTLTWHASKNKIHKLHLRCILCVKVVNYVSWASIGTIKWQITDVIQGEMLHWFMYHWSTPWSLSTPYLPACQVSYHRWFRSLLLCLCATSFEH